MLFCASLYQRRHEMQKKLLDQLENAYIERAVNNYTVW
jgi:hypothetical protein